MNPYTYILIACILIVSILNQISGETKTKKIIITKLKTTDSEVVQKIESLQDMHTNLLPAVPPVVEISSDFSIISCIAGVGLVFVMCVRFIQYKTRYDFIKEIVPGIVSYMPSTVTNKALFGLGFFF